MLTQKQENFCHAYLKTGNASEAYRQSYNAENMKVNSINTKAYELLQNGEITDRLEELKKPTQEKLQLTLDYIGERMLNNINGAEMKGEYNTAIRGLEAIAKLFGLSKEKMPEDYIKEEHKAAIVQNFLERQKILDVTPE